MTTEVEKSFKIIGPKPYTQRPPVAHKTVPPKPNREKEKAFPPPQQIVTSDILKQTKLRKANDANQVTNETSNNIDSNISNNTAPEFLKHKLKTPAERKAEAANKKPNIPSKPPKPSSKPVKTETQTLEVNEINKSHAEIENKIDNNNNNDEFLKENEPKIRSGSVLNNRDFFEKMAKDSSLKREPKVPKKPIRISKNETEHKKETPNESKENLIEHIETEKEIGTNNVSPKPKTDHNVMKNQDADDDVYDDVTCAYDPHIENGINGEPNDELDEAEIMCNLLSYETETTGNEVHTNILKHSIIEDETTYEVDEQHVHQNHETENIAEDKINEDFYDDVMASVGLSQNKTITSVVKSDNNCNRINQADVNEKPNVIEEDFYDEVSCTIPIDTETAVSVRCAPVKPPRNFTPIPSDKISVPNLLESWLKNIMAERQSCLKETCSYKERMVLMDNKSSQMEMSHDHNEITEDLTYDVLAEKERVDLTKSFSVSENKKIERKTTLFGKKPKEERIREKQEKKEKEEREKKEKMEKKKREKEFKKFNLNVNEELTFGGTLTCREDSKNQDKHDLQYREGEDINIIEYSKCPKGKLLAQHVTSGRIGYISKEEFGIIDSSDDVDGQSIPSPIPFEETIVDMTNAGEQEFYNEVELPPPIPVTPRPHFLSEGRPPMPPPNLDQPSFALISRSNQLHSPVKPEPIPTEDELYDDIMQTQNAPISPGDHISTSRPSLPLPTAFPSKPSSPNSIITEDELYDDVAQGDSSTVHPPQDFGDTYDDVAGGGADITEDQIYDVAY